MYSTHIRISYTHGILFAKLYASPPLPLDRTVANGPMYLQRPVFMPQVKYISLLTIHSGTRILSISGAFPWPEAL